MCGKSLQLGMNNEKATNNQIFIVLRFPWNSIFSIGFFGSYYEFERFGFRSEGFLGVFMTLFAHSRYFKFGVPNNGGRGEGGGGGRYTI